ncbi:Nitroreductase [Minicystis rosea]|nr:Nitroreductase [Minicystis rosea]
MHDLEQAITERRSTRKFLPRPVPRALLDECLSLAQRAPSNSNIQPWRVVFAAGAARDRLQTALLTEARKGPPNIPPLPEAFQRHRRELGSRVYGAMGITREDKAARAAAVLRNFEFFGAPLVGIVGMHRDLGPADAVGVGMFLQTLVLTLTARGVGTCVAVSLAGYPEVLRRELGIPEELAILCGVAVGYADPDFPGNGLHIGREPIEKNVAFVDE